MKKVIIFLGISFSLHAQIDSLKTTFSEEKVEKFEKTTLIDEYDKVFGGNRQVNSGLRFKAGEIGNFPLIGIIPEYEQKIGSDFSIIGSITGGYSSNRGWLYETSLEGRWYYAMKNRVKVGKQKANITGNFISFKSSYSNFLQSNQPSVNILRNGNISSSTSLNPLFFYKKSTSILWGKQLGNNVAFGLTMGVNFGDEYFNKNQNFPLDSSSPLVPLYVKKANMPYFSTFSQIGIGFMFPRKSKFENDNCEFLKCNYTVNRMFKLNLNEALYIDKYVQNIKTDVGFEQRIAKSNFTVNTYILGSFSNFKTLEILSYKDSTLTYDGRTFRTRIPTYSNRNINDFTCTFSGTTQLRYYFGKKTKVYKNFNGLYTGLEHKILYTKFTKFKVSQSLSKLSNYTNSMSGIVGYQTQTSLGTFLDFTGSLGLEKTNYNKLKGYGTSQFHFEVDVKLGIAK